MTGRSSEKRYTFVSVLERSDNRLWGCHFRVPDRVAVTLKDKSSRRVVCRLNDAIQYQCAILSHGRGESVITVNKQIRQKLGVDVGTRVEVVLMKDRAEYGLPFPDELREVLRQDKAGNVIMHSLTPGKLRTLLYIIDKAKSQDKRIERSLIIVDHLKSNKGKIDYRQLTRSLKSPPGASIRSRSHRRTAEN